MRKQIISIAILAILAAIVDCRHIIQRYGKAGLQKQERGRKKEYVNETELSDDAITAGLETIVPEPNTEDIAALQSAVNGYNQLQKEYFDITSAPLDAIRQQNYQPMQDSSIENVDAYQSSAAYHSNAESRGNKVDEGKERKENEDERKKTRF